jgi:hypothetical protein
MADNFQTPIGLLRCYGPTLFVPARNKFDPGKDPRFEASVVIDKAGQDTAEYKALKAGILAVAKAKFGDKMSEKAFVAKLKLPIKADDADDTAMVIKAWSKKAPEVIDGALNDITVQADVWSGQRARLIVAPWAFDSNGARGVTLFLNGCQITKRDMPRLDGSVSAKKVFSKVEDDSAPSSLAGEVAEDDDLPF